ncbi:DUF2807 domain-containing protein [Flavobacterium agricola]|uniref:DUF2807 domain-containing protein n=1 Tax=Flavobacterium agricola TaxID=2870839 RepID=A0ABY6LYF2_9FLAO|nr:DUF2807 domain-containing protein [Flavobacterium agricola]UYW01370.1 DUF2807 domain-containing protein [Flavobacterium agricola]
MRKFYILLFGLFFITCSPDKLDDCLGATGAITSQVVQLSDFSKLNVGEGVEVELIEHPVHKIEIQTGHHSQKYVSFQVTDGELFLKNSLTCTLGYVKPAVIKVYTPNLIHIYSNSQFNMYAKQTLFFPNLTIEHGLTMKNASSVFHININTNNLIIQTNNLSSFVLTGQANNLSVSFWGGGSRLEAYNFQANHVRIIQRSTNNMYINALQSIKGTIYGYGNVYLKQAPLTIDVVELYKGKLIVD